jgi:hypothetical protein
MAPRRAMYLYIATIAVANGEASLSTPPGPGSVSDGRLLWKGACPLVCSRNALQSLQLDRLIKSTLG